jgi:hypothetical protein
MEKSIPVQYSPVHWHLNNPTLSCLNAMMDLIILIEYWEHISYHFQFSLFAAACKSGNGPETTAVPLREQPFRRELSWTLKCYSSGKTVLRYANIRIRLCFKSFLKFNWYMQIIFEKLLSKVAIKSCENTPISFAVSVCLSVYPLLIKF